MLLGGLYSSIKCQIGAMSLGGLGERTLQDKLDLSGWRYERVPCQQGQTAGTGSVAARRPDHDGSDDVQKAHLPISLTRTAALRRALLVGICNRQTIGNGGKAARGPLVIEILLWR